MSEDTTNKEENVREGLDPQFFQGSTSQYLPYKGLTEQTCRVFDIKTWMNDEGKPVYVEFPFACGKTQRKLLEPENPKARYLLSGETKNPGLFGADRFGAGSAKAITITEGPADAASVYQMMGDYPVVSVLSSGSAEADCKAAFEYLNSFEKIYLCFDNDPQGRKAKSEVARLFEFNKVYDVNMTLFKDANEYLENKKFREFRTIWHNAKKRIPDDITSTLEDFKQIIKEKKRDSIADFPYEELQRKTFGVRPEIYLFTAMEGVGKTEIVRAIEYHLLSTTDYNMGILHVEEDKARALRGIATYELKSPVHLPDSNVGDEDVVGAIERVVRRNDRLHVYRHGDDDDPDVVLDRIRFMVAVLGCKFIVLDHITWLVTQLDEGDERKKLDYLSTKLKKMVDDLDFTLFLVSHVNDDGKTRGSRNISKVANTWIHLDRAIESPDPEVRNITKLIIKKNRFCGRTGPAGALYFNPETGMLEEKIQEEIPF